MTARDVPADGRLRLFSYTSEDSSPRIGLAVGGSAFIDVAEAAKAQNVALSFNPSSMLSLIEAGDAGLAECRKLAHTGAKHSLDHIKILPPLPKLSKNIFCVGWNYLEHFEEGQEFRGGDQKLPDHPVFFTKAVTALNGPYDPIPYDPAVSTEIDWEVELAVVIGKRGRNLTEANAAEHIFGYAVMNDVSARDLQQRLHGGQWFKGKSLDGHAPLGPWIVPANEVDRDNLRLILRVNGEIKQDGSTKQMYFKIPRILAELSKGLTLEPGDVIATGTPPGVGFARKPPEYLRPGDVMESEITGIGTLVNRIGQN
jgi:2-keto-4-pentenoate hydratase/2-oxohepta-3-ene-1,7-dioic acid hydratase in catechol pathway